MKSHTKISALLLLGLMQSTQAGGFSGLLAKQAGAGAYIGASVGQSTLEPRVKVAGGGVDDKSDGGYKFQLGYKFNQHFALEGFYGDFGKAKIHTATKKGEVGYKLYGLSGVFTKKLSKRFNGLVKLGYAKVDNNVTKGISYRQIENGDIFGGLGVEYVVSSRLSIRGEYEYYDKDIQMLSVGFNWKF